jgi:ATP-dependent helicase/nuclease subunit A
VVVSPSGASPHARPDRALETAAAAVREAGSARREGLALHALLQHLPGVAAADRRPVALRAIEALLPDSPSRHAALAEKALNILEKPAHADIFGPQSRGEVPFLAEATREGKPIRLFGRMDRLIVSGDRVTVIDFKSDAAPRLDPVNPAYLTQVGLYALVAAQLFPGSEVDAAILWTNLESLVKLDRAALAEAVQGFTVR